MEQPKHDLRTQMGDSAAAAAPRRLGGLIIVGILHVGLVAALIIGLKQGAIMKKIEDIKVSVEKEKVQPKPPPPPPPTLKVPPPPFVPPPEFVIQQDNPAPTTAITTQSVVKTPPAPPPPTQLRPLTRTHTLPPYPAIALRLNQQGTTVLRVTISTDGDVTEATIEKSSGYDILDQAAVNFVKSHWRWEPPTQNGHPTAASTLVGVRWDVKNAQ